MFMFDTLIKQAGWPYTVLALLKLFFRIRRAVSLLGAFKIGKHTHSLG